MHSRFILLAALAAAATAQQVFLDVCTDSNIANQLWAFDAQNQHIFLLKSPTQCIDASTGCCYGEDIRGSDVLSVSTCTPNTQTQIFGWPAAGGAAPWSLQPTSTFNEPIRGITPGGPLVFDALGAFFPGSFLIGRPYDPVSSVFVPDGPASGARIVNNASGLCLTALSSAATVSQQLSLQQCASEGSLTPGAYASTQLFRNLSSGALLTSQGLCVTAQQVLGAAGSWPGTMRVIGASCTPTQPYLSQGFDVIDGGVALTWNSYYLSAGTGVWQGTPLFLAPGPSFTPANTFVFRPLSANASYGQLVHAATGMCADTAGVPYGHSCLHPSVRALPYCDNTLPQSDRVSDLVSRLTLEEAVSLLGSSNDVSMPCISEQPAIPRLDVSPLRRLVEITSMASSSCPAAVLYNASCATGFPAGMLVAGTFNRTLFTAHGDVVGTELRAFANANPPGPFQDLSRPSPVAYGPDINQPRDPRNGRNGELLSEDPYLSGICARDYVAGVQYEGGNTSSPMRALTSLKHFTAYSRETDRMSSTGDVSVFDLWDTYLPQYKAALTEANAGGTMCSYMSVRLTNSTSDAYIPSCANPYLLTTVVREYWGRPDATHLSDCGAVWNMWTANDYVRNVTQAAAAALNAGMDMNSNTVSPSQLAFAVSIGMVTEDTVRAAAGRLLAQRFALRQFDPLESLPAAVGGTTLADVGTPANVDVAVEAVAQGMVLVRNDNDTLPLRAGRRLAVLGPTCGDLAAHIGDSYAQGTGYCPSGDYDCVPLVANTLSELNGANTTVAYPGVTVLGNDSSWGDALLAVTSADTVVLCLGTDRTVAAEGKDANFAGLPGLQGQFAAAVLSRAHAAAVPVVLLLIHNVPISFDDLVQPANSTYTPVAAIVDTWAPVLGGRVVAEALFGVRNRWGRAVLTTYPAEYLNEVSLFSYDMSLPPGRSYRYYTGTPLIPFGSGLSYSTFAVACAGAWAAPPCAAVAVTCNVTNTSPLAGDEVLMLYHRPGSDIVGAVNASHPLPLKALVAFDRLSLSPAEAGVLSFTLNTSSAFVYVNQNGAQVLYSGTHFVDVSNGNSANVTLSFTVPEQCAGIIAAPPLP